jgi:hypothetical protein
MGRRLRYNPLGGEFHENWAVLTDQFLAFKNFLNGLASDSFVTSEMIGNERALNRMLSFFGERLHDNSEVIYNLNRIADILSISPLCTPAERKIINEDKVYYSSITSGMVISLLAVVEPSTMHVAPPSMDMIEAGRGACLTIQRYAESHSLVSDVRPKESYFKRQIAEAAFQLMPEGFLKETLRSVVLGQMSKEYINNVSSAVINAAPTKWLQFRRKAREIIRQYPHHFGYTDSFVYLPNPRFQSSQGYSEDLFELYIHNLPSDTEYQRSYDFSSLIDSILQANHFNTLENSTDRDWETMDV